MQILAPDSQAGGAPEMGSRLSTS